MIAKAVNPPPNRGNSRGRVWHAACAIFWLLGGGFLVGLAVGYASHLALDLFSPRGPPLLV